MLYALFPAARPHSLIVVHDARSVGSGERIRGGAPKLSDPESRVMRIRMMMMMMMMMQ
jgi:hypothetical protein